MNSIGIYDNNFDSETKEYLFFTEETKKYICSLIELENIDCPDLDELKIVLNDFYNNKQNKDFDYSKSQIEIL
jgi:hypothetical protein